MINIDIEEIRKNLEDINICLYVNFQNRFTWIQYKDSIGDDLNIRKIKSDPLYNRNIIGNDHDPYANQVCFGRFTYGSDAGFRSPRNYVFNLKVNRKLQHTTTTTCSTNFCWLSKEMISLWLNICKEESGINFRYAIDDSEEGYYYLYIDFRETNSLSIKYVLFWARAMFEVPTNLDLLDTLLLKRDVFQDELVTNLFTMVDTVNLGNRFRTPSSQNFSIFGRFLSQNELRTRLKNKRSMKEGGGGVFSHYTQDENGIRPTMYDITYKINTGDHACFDIIYTKKGSQIKRIYPTFTSKDLDKRNGLTLFNPVKHWIDTFDLRLQKYREVYPIYKEEKEI